MTARFLWDGGDRTGRRVSSIMSFDLRSRMSSNGSMFETILVRAGLVGSADWPYAGEIAKLLY